MADMVDAGTNLDVNAKTICMLLRLHYHRTLYAGMNI